MRTCSITGNEMTSGWVWGDGTFYTSTLELTLKECRKNRDSILHNVHEDSLIEEEDTRDNFKESLDRVRKNQETDEDLLFIAYQTGYLYYTEFEDSKNMKTINIEIPKGHEIDQEQSNLSEGRIVFKEIKKELPKKWEELPSIKGWWVGDTSRVFEANTTANKINKLIFATKELAEASIALAQLSQLREVYRDGWEPDWNDQNQPKYTIYFWRNKIHFDTYFFIHKFLSFQSEEIRDKFSKNFASLIETAKPLMS